MADSQPNLSVTFPQLTQCNWNSRFWSRVTVNQETDCWLWTGQIAHGYGITSYKSKHWKCHRIVWVLLNGDVAPGMHVCHQCDVRNCVNPSHLFIGSQSDNMQDCSRKMRNIMQMNPERCYFLKMPNELRPRGEGNGSSKLREDDVREIRRLRDLGKTDHEITASLGKVALTTVRDVMFNKTWRHVI